MNIIFLGGLFSRRQHEFIVANSFGVVQNAANVLQSNLVRGLEEVTDSRVSVVNLPFVGAYPRRFRYGYFPAERDSIGFKSTIYGFGFLNISLIKYISRMISAMRGLISVGHGGAACVLVYSAHLPFIIAALIYRRIYPGVKVCVVIPDLPEYMGDGGVIYRLLKKIECGIFYALVRRFDYFVVITEQMIDRLNVARSKAVVVEGVAATPPIQSVLHEDEFREGPKIVFYSGTLARRYGVLDLLEAFQNPELREHELWICGDGDGRGVVESAARKYSNVKYLGQLPHSQVIKLQARATILVNPRPPSGEFTKFSFPSKILEYMVSGRPVVMYRLPGIPAEYKGFYMAPEGVGVQPLAACLINALRMDAKELNEFGLRAKSFVVTEKNPSKQAEKIIQLLRKGD